MTPVEIAVAIEVAIVIIGIGVLAYNVIKNDRR